MTRAIPSRSIRRNLPRCDFVHSIGNASVPPAFRPWGQAGVRALEAARKAVTVLVVEDDWLIRENIVTDLRQEGWAVLEAATGAGALTALHDGEKVDLLITDIKLADAMTGWDVADAFRTSHPEVPVVSVPVRKSRQRSSPIPPAASFLASR